MKFWCLFVILLWASCTPPELNVVREVQIELSDLETQKIYRLIHEEKVDSLLSYISSANPTHRYLCAYGLASIRKAISLDSLYPMLQDSLLKVRTAAAFAIGQIANQKSTPPLIKSFKTEDTISVNNEFNSNILEALGKLANKEVLEQIASVTTYRKSDTLLLLGQARAIFQFGLRDLDSPLATDRMCQFLLEPHPDKVREIAAAYLGRFKKADISGIALRLLEVLSKESNPIVRQHLVIALGRTKLPEIEQHLTQRLIYEQDVRVMTHIIKSLYNAPYINVAEPILKKLKSDQIAIAQAAAQYILDNGNKEDIIIYRSYVNDSMAWQTKATLYGALLRHSPLFYTRVKNEYKDDLLFFINKTKDPYQKAAYIRSLGEDPFQYRVLIDLAKKVKTPIECNAVTEALITVLNHPGYYKVFGEAAFPVRREIITQLMTLIKPERPGVVIILGEFFRNTKFQIRPMLEELSAFKVVKESLKMPQDLETYIEIEKTLAWFEKRTPVPPPPQAFTKIDWTSLATVTDSTQVIVKTSAGNFKIKLFPKEAPATVSHFLSLINSDYYDDKVFHRVVPGFVIQGGCPIGDGYGGGTLLLRSEVFQARFDRAGLLGMASAGPNTESVQFFVTQGPAPHLDGKYTIFGEIIEGMETVQKIQIGDRIIDMIVSNNSKLQS